MNCPFCQHANAATARACRVCGAPLRAAQPEIAPVVRTISPAPVAPAARVASPALMARRAFDENASAPICADFSGDEDSIVRLVRANGDLQMWNAQTDALHTFAARPWPRRLSPLCCAAVTFNFSATGHQNGAVRLTSFDGRERKTAASHLGPVLALAMSATHLYSGGSDGVIWATELEARNAKSRALIEGLGALTTFAVAPDATLIAVGCDDGAVQLWRANAETETFQLDWTRRVHGAPLASLAFSPNGQMIVSRDQSGALCLWAAQSSYQLPLPPRAQCSHVAPAWASDSRLLALANAGRAQIWDVAPGTLVGEVAGLDETIAHLSWARAAPWLLLAGAREIAIWKVA